MEQRGAVFRTILARTMDPDAADEATAEAFARAYAHWDDTVAEHPNPLAWVLRVAWNNHLSSWRTWERRRAPDPPAPKWPTPQLPVDPNLVAAIRSLPGGQRDVLVLAALGGLTPAEIAKLLGKAPGTVRAQLHRARTGLTAPEVAATLGRSAALVRSLQHRGIATLLRAPEPVDQEPHHDHVVPSEDAEPSSP
jgi:DNA-directed RNA polymerase specialized sigma24 family protein